MILVTGGLGYIGSHLVVKLLNSHYDVIILDNLSNSSIEVLDHIETITHKIPIFYKGCISDEDILQKIIENHKITNIIHLAGFKSVKESELYPEKYWDNNVNKSKIFLDFMYNSGIKNIIFSSTATVYEPSDSALTEDCPTNPISVYGKTKLEIEQYLKTLYSTALVNITILRYFNPIGEHSSGLLVDTGSDNLYPNIKKALNEDTTFSIYGFDYDTPDGTPIRDYIDIENLVKYHILFLNFKGFDIFNIGTGVGKSVFEVVKEFPGLKYRYKPRREGDAPILVCSIDKLNRYINKNNS